ncbi:hypothetical protein HMPREF1981_02693 [Bacteroides pyogenes F0041]|uniref:Uncharacterized protein n=1 Tax=Bacteroides pyogenes F0041 TaxID=1321819 RepID=U2CDA6_9BACE|nr:hypothetical protein HMPREF1981_02693 [Bacteroides pyogenes F0041]
MLLYGLMLLRQHTIKIKGGNVVLFAEHHLATFFLSLTLLNSLSIDITQR